VRKLENYLGVKIRKGENQSAPEQNRFVKPGISETPAAKEARERFEKEGKFDKNTTENLTISDLKEIEKKKETEGSGGFFSFLKRKKKPEAENIQEETSKDSKDENDISNEEANEILFGK
jgi:hypothetical protein